MRGFAITLALGGALLLAGCSGGDAGKTAEPSGTNPAPKTTTEKKFTIGVSLPAATHGWTAGAIWWAEEAKKQHPDMNIKVVTAENPEKQVADIETLMAEKVNALVILATESAPLTPVAEKVHEAGILLVNVDRGFTKPVADVFLQGDNVGFGRKSAEFMVQQLKGKGSIIILEGISSTVNTDRVNGAKEVWAKNPGIKILDSQPGNWNRNEALKAMETLLAKHKQVDAIWASDDDMLLGAEQALKEANRTGVWMLGGGGMKDIVKRVMDKDPAIPATVTYSPKMVNDAVNKAVEMLKAGWEAKADRKQEAVISEITVITPENAKDFYFPDSVY